LLVVVFDVGFVLAHVCFGVARVTQFLLLSLAVVLDDLGVRRFSL